MRISSRTLSAGLLGIVLATTSAGAEVARTTANDGNLVMEDVPPVPDTLVDTLNRYQNVRSAGFQDWTEDGSGVFVTTRFGDVSQIHHVGHPGGARSQARRASARASGQSPRCCMTSARFSSPRGSGS